AEEAVVGADVAQAAAEEGLGAAGRQVAQPARLDLPQVGPRLPGQAAPGDDEGGGLGGPRQAAADGAVEGHAGQQAGGGPGLGDPGEAERHRRRREGPPVGVEVLDGAVTHQVDAATGRFFVCVRGHVVTTMRGMSTPTPTPDWLPRLEAFLTERTGAAARVTA